MSRNDDPIRVSTVEYLNTKPINFGLENGRLAHRFELSYDVPAVCAQKLSDGAVELALIPSIEYSRIRRHRSLSIVPGVAVASVGPVSSVLLVFNKSLETLKRVAVDTSSKTSVALLEIILREKYDIAPELVPMKADLDTMLKMTDAALVIGDFALEAAPDLEGKIDLGDEWNDLTDGLPFVYSFWAGVQDRIEDTDVRMLQSSLDMGLRASQEIAESYSQSHLHDATYYHDYLKRTILYRLEKDELNGLREFYSYCFYYGILDEVPEMFFFGEPNTRE